MAVTITGHQECSASGITPSGATFTIPAIVRNTGEGLLVWFVFRDQFAWPAAPTGAVWDAAGDNQAMVLREYQQTYDFRAIALFELKNPTSAKTADITITHAGSNIHSAWWGVDKVSGFDPDVWVRDSSIHVDPNPQTNDLTVTVDSASGDLAIFCGYTRSFATGHLTAGNLSNFVAWAETGFFTMARGTRAGAAPNVTGTIGYTPAEAYDTGVIGVSIASAPSVTPTVTGAVALADAVAAGGLAVNESAVAGTIALDDLAPAGSLSIAGVSALEGAVVLAANVASGSLGSVVGTVTTQAFKSTVTKQPLPGLAVARAVFLNAADGTLAANVPTPPPTDANGRLTITSTGLTPGESYMLVAWNTDGSQAGVQKVLAA